MFPIKPLKFRVSINFSLLNKTVIVGISPKIVAIVEKKVKIIALKFSLNNIWTKPEKINKIIEINKNNIIK